METNEREPTKEAKPRGCVGGQPVKLEEEEVRSESGGGWTATEVLTTDNGISEKVRDEGGMSVREAVKADREERGAKGPSHPEGTHLTSLGQPFAIFHHPSEFTEEEDAVIANGLLANLPLYMIAAKLNCSRNLLSKHIKESKLLSEAYADGQESFIDNVEWQAKRLIDSGNAAMIMFALERKGKDRGWGQQPVQDVDMDDTRIVIGEIPEAEVEAAEAKVKEAEAEAGVTSPANNETGDKTQDPPKAEVQSQKPSPAAAQQKMPTPMEMALMDEAAKEAARAVRDEGTVTIPPEDVRVEPAPWDDGYGGGDSFSGEGGFDESAFGGFM